MQVSRQNTYCVMPLAARENLFLMALDSDVSPSDQLRFDSVVGRRAASEPSAYITGHREFYGLDFKVDSRTLIPRPETELLLELVLEFAARRTSRDEGLNIAEVGVGCGAIAIALAVNLSGASDCGYGHLTCGTETWQARTYPGIESKTV